MPKILSALNADSPSTYPSQANFKNYVWGTPANKGVVEYNMPPEFCTVSNQLTTGNIYGFSFQAQTSSSVSNFGLGLIGTASTPTSGQNLLGLYSISSTTATRIAITGDLGNWNNNGIGFNSYPFSGAAQTLSAGTWYVVLAMSNASSPAHLAGIANGNGYVSTYCARQSNTAAPWYSFHVQTLSGATALPSSYTISSTTMGNLSSSLPIWVSLY